MLCWVTNNPTSQQLKATKMYFLLTLHVQQRVGPGGWGGALHLGIQLTEGPTIYDTDVST